MELAAATLILSAAMQSLGPRVRGSFMDPGRGSWPRILAFVCLEIRPRPFDTVPAYDAAYAMRARARFACVCASGSSAGLRGFGGGISPDSISYFFCRKYCFCKRICLHL